MRRRKLNLRGSVTQNTPVRLRAQETTRLGVLLRFSAVVGAIVLLAGFVVLAWHLGWPQRQAEHLINASLNMTQKAHFAVADIQAEGREQTSKEALEAALGTQAGAPILAFDPGAAQARIAKLPWVASATVERRLPDTIVVRLTERVPLARWQMDGRTVVVDVDGKELPGAKIEQFSQLPLIVGFGAPAAAKTLLDALKDESAVTEKMTAAVRVSGRRWDIYLQPKVIAKLPETGLPDALKRLAQLITEQKILDHDITAIDLRLPDRFIIEPSANTATHPTGTPHL